MTKPFQEALNFDAPRVEQAEPGSHAPAPLDPRPMDGVNALGVEAPTERMAAPEECPSRALGQLRRRLQRAQKSGWASGESIDSVLGGLRLALENSGTVAQSPGVGAEPGSLLEAFSASTPASSSVANAPEADKPRPPGPKGGEVSGGEGSP